MDYIEKMVPLEPEDYKILAKKRNRAVITVAIIELVVTALPVSYAVAPNFFLNGPDQIMIWMITGILYLALFAILVFFVLRHRWDVSSGNKKQIEGIMIQKQKITERTGSVKNRSSSTAYYFSFRNNDNKQIKVDWNTYSKVENGDKIKICLAGYTGTVLTLETKKTF